MLYLFLLVVLVVVGGFVGASEGRKRNGKLSEGTKWNLRYALWAMIAVEYLLLFTGHSIGAVCVGIPVVALGMFNITSTVGNG